MTGTPVSIDFLRLLIGVRPTCDLVPDACLQSAREHYLRIKTCKSVERYLFSDDRKSALIKFYLRSRCFGLNARTQHGDGDDITDRKACSLCNLKIIEDEEHFLLVCPEYSVSRRLMWFNIEAALEDSV